MVNLDCLGKWLIISLLKCIVMGSVAMVNLRHLRGGSLSEVY